MSVRVIGVDACKAGWVGISGERRGYFGATIEELISSAEQDGPLAVVAIDIPIGLPVEVQRQADVLARRLIGKRSASVFSTPVRAALLAATHAEASALNRAATGKGLSQQAYALRTKILEVDAWSRTTHHQVIESHPELCFATMAGRPLAHRKSTWAGIEERREILASVSIAVPSDLGLAGELAAVDDVLDAAAVSWTAQRHAEGRSVAYPDPPELVEGGALAAIWV